MLFYDELTVITSDSLSFMPVIDSRQHVSQTFHTDMVRSTEPLLHEDTANMLLWNNMTRRIWIGGQQWTTEEVGALVLLFVTMYGLTFSKTELTFVVHFIKLVGIDRSFDHKEQMLKVIIIKP